MASLERGRIPSPSPVAAREIPLIDRVEELKLLKEAVDRTVQGEGEIVFLHGEAGIGKTRLARELRAYARLRGMQVLYGRCPSLYRMDGVPPYVLWSEVIRGYLDDSSMEQLYRVIGYYPAEVAKLVPEISQKLRAIPQSFPISPEQEQNRLFEAVSQFITNISREAPLLVVLDDLHGSDPSSLLLFHYLARGVQKSPLLLLGAYRSAEVDAKHPLTPVLTELNKEGLAQSVQLKRMSLSDVSEMIKCILEQDDVLAEFCKLVYEKTKGNPFFLEEVVKSLKEEDVIYREGNRWKIKEISRIEFPETVKSVVKARLSRLDEECQNVLTLASFVGNDFTLEAMCLLTGIEEDKLLELMDRMLKTGLIKEREIRGEGVCSFADSLVRDVVYEEISLLKRKKLHGTVGIALEKVYGKKIDEHCGELASHFLESGDKDKALHYFLKAAEKAAKIYANSEATSYLQSALGLLGEKEGEPKEKGRVLERLGDIKKLVGEFDACMKYWNQALPLWLMLKEKGKTAALHRKMANVLWERIGDKDKAKEHHEAALKILETERESVELAHLYEDMAHMLRRKGQVAKALTLAEKALLLAEKLNTLEVVADSCIELALERAMTGDFKKGLEYANRALKIALDNDYLETAVLAYGRVVDLLPSEEYEKCLDVCDKGLALAKKLGDSSLYAYMVNWQAILLTRRGELDKAKTLEEEALELAKKTGELVFIPWYLRVLGETYQKLGEWEKSEQYYKEVMDAARNQNEFQIIAWCHFDFGRLYFDKAKYTKAKESLEEAINVVKTAGAITWQMAFSQVLIWTSIELGELKKAQNLLDDVRKFALETEGKIYWMDTLAIDSARLSEMALRAMLLRAQKKYAESIGLFEKTLQEWQSIGANIWNAYYFVRWVLCEYARVYLDRDDKGDREEAHSLLKQALEMFRKMNAKKDIEKTTRLLEALHPPVAQAHERAVSSEGLEYTDVQSNITATPRELKLGESLELELEVTNTRRKGSILLIKITEIIPESFAIAKKPEFYRMEGNCLIMREKRLGPSRIEVVKLVLTPKVLGTFHIRPKIVYLAADGKERTCEPKPVNVTVKELGIKGWLRGER